jgi:predicted dehydrogenase
VRWTEQRNLSEFLRLVAAGAVDVETMTSHRFPVERAAEAYELLSGGGATGTRPVGVVLTYGRADPTARRLELRPSAARRRSETVRVGLIGAGSFATRVLLPALADDSRVELVGIASATGLTARDVASRFGFRYAASDTDALIGDEDVDAVVVATRHDSHAALATQALAAGKTVFCEKPLATTTDELESVIAATQRGEARLLVGFNRRFSPLAVSLREALPTGVPRALAYRVNAGAPVPGHWTGDPLVGGGRLIGEVCHFLDFACYLAEQRPVSVAATDLGTTRGDRDDSVVVEALFRCGSVAAIQYLANGDPTVPKERIEVFCGGLVATIDDFRKLELVQDGRRRRHGRRGQQKGHREEIHAFVELALGHACELLPLEEALWSTALTLQARRALGERCRIPVELPIVAEAPERADPAPLLRSVTRSKD